jgi:hypothetical protein
MTSEEMTPEQIQKAKVVAAVIGIAFLLTIVAIEIILGLERKPSNTFSDILRGWAIVGLAAPFGWGTLAGHFFHPVDSFRSVLSDNDNANLIVAVGAIVALAIVDLVIATTTKGVIYPTWCPPMMLALGCVWGALIWPVVVED